MNLNIRFLACIKFISAIALITSNAFAGTINISNYPISTSTNANVKPNLMYIIDDSGSMDSIFLPDTAYYSPQAAQFRKYVKVDASSDLFYGSYKDRDTLENHGYNKIWYTPDIRYDPPANFNIDGSENKTQYPSMDGSSLSSGALPTEPRRNWKAFSTMSYNNSGARQICPRDVYDLPYDPTVYNNSKYCNLEDISGYWSIRPSEYCKDKDLKYCTFTASPTGEYIYPAEYRWCDFNNPYSGGCSGKRGMSNSSLRMPRPQQFNIAITNTSISSTVNSISINGKNILKEPVSFTASELSKYSSASGPNAKYFYARKVVAAINACTYNKSGACEISGYHAYFYDYLGNLPSNFYVVLPTKLTNGMSPQVVASNVTISASNVADHNDTIDNYGNFYVGNVVFTPISRDKNSYVDSTGSAFKHPNRTDCVGTTCTYEEEMTNFANWVAYYSNRLATMKTQTSQAFKQVDDKLRVGFVPISFIVRENNFSRYLKINDFNAKQKYNWYQRLFNTPAGPDTPLRAALSYVGKLYAGQNPYNLNNLDDPVQYSCQANYALLTTDGSWNDKTTDFSGINGEPIGNVDGDNSPRPKYDVLNTPNTLADVAKYYYDTDLRDASTSPYCKSPEGVDLCADNVPTSISDKNNKQHMVTFTLGLGVDGYVKYSPTYLTDVKGEFSDIVSGKADWPDPYDDTGKIDDLWHAAVNGNGKYFSAADPTYIKESLSELVETITSRMASGSASATSSLRPVPGENSVFVASYKTGVWSGNVEARTVDTINGTVSQNSTWCAESIVDSGFCSNGTVSSKTTGGSKQFYCSTQSSQYSCARSKGVFDSSSSTCTKEIPTACVGTMRSLVSSSSDTRNILMRDVKNNINSLVPFKWENLSDQQKTYFSKSRLSTILSQTPKLSSTQVELAQNENLVNYLRGQNQYEMKSDTANPLFRVRTSTMGDVIESSPIYIGKPTFSYGDPGYQAFKEAKKSRTGILVVGANDGMLHAFNGKTGQELWAYIPSDVIGNMPYLADSNYSKNHKWFVNGDPIISDVCFANCADAANSDWRTILVGGLRAGGSMYYALDITDTTNPKLLWEFTKANDADLGLTFGSPVITKGATGNWFVLFTSGHNNVNGSNQGKGVVYVVNPKTGSIVRKLITSAGSADNPSGLVDISAYARSSEVNNQTVYAYSGDLLGNVWRFNIDENQSSSNPQKLTTLVDASGSTQPITSKIEIGLVNDYPLLMVGTGRVLEASDVENKSSQSLYALLDNGTPINSPRDYLVKKTLTTSGDIRTVNDGTVDYNTKRGWYVDLPDVGERAIGKPVLSSGVVVFSSVVPSPTYCTPGGYSYLNYFNYKDGRSIDSSTKAASIKTEAPVVGINLMYINNTPSISYVTTDDPTPQRATAIRYNGTMSGFQSKRSMWREMLVE